MEEKDNKITSLKSDLDEVKEEKEQSEKKPTMKIW